MRMRGAVALALLALTLSALPADAAPRWQQAETAHFIVVFEQENRYAADQVLTFCEEVYGQVTAFFGSSPARRAKIPCVIHGGMDYANGSTTPFPGRIDLSLTAPSDHSMGARSESWLRIVFTHELAHFVHLGMDRGPFAALSRVFGSDVAMGSAIFLPGWMIEGAAVNLETILTAGGRGRSPLFEIYSKAPVMEGDLFSLRQAGYDSSFPPPGRIYVAGHILVDHILTEFGADAFARIMDAYLAFPFFGPWAAIEKVTGKKAAAVYAEMRESLAARYAPSAALEPGTRLTADATADYRRPQATGRGLYLYRTSPDQVPAIVRLDPVTGKEEELARVALTDDSSFAATADGETVYFASLAWDWRRPGTGEAVSDLYRLAVRTGKITRITRGAHLWQPAVSADGLRLAAVRADGPYSSLVSVDPVSGMVTELYARQGTNVFTPAFSPDGLSLAFTLNERGYQDICLLPLTGPEAGGMRLLTGPDRNGEYYPAFLDEGRVIFSSDRTGSMCLYTVDTRSGDLAMVLEEPVAAISGIREGGSLVYESYRSRGFCLRQVPLAELDAQAVDHPVARPDAEEIAPAPEWTGATVASRPYHDIALPYVWYPWIPFTISSAGSLDVGVGAQALGGSLLDISAWSLGLAWHPGTSQPRAELGVSSALGNLRVDSSFAMGYAADATASEEVSGQLLLTLPLAWQHSLGTSIAVFARTGLAFEASLQESFPFDFAHTLSTPADHWSRSLRVAPGISARWQPSRAARDLYPTRDLSASLDFSCPLPVFPATGIGERFTLYLSASMPSPFAWRGAPAHFFHHALKLGAKASWTAVAVEFIDPFVAPRGAFSSTLRSGPGIGLVSIDYLVPVALLDAPIILGLGLTGLGIGVHAEWAGEFGVAPSFIQPDAELYAGVELALQLTAGIQPFPVGVGLSARIRTDGRAFDPAADLRPYIFFSVDSFRDSARPVRLPQ